MAENYLITGYWGEPHVTSENDRGINAAMFGSGRFVLPVGEKFRAEYIGNNIVRMYDGKLMNNGAAGGITAGEFVDILVTYAEVGKNRNDLIVFQYQLDASTLVEKGTFVVVQGAEVVGTPSDPSLTQQDLLSNEATLDQMPLYRVSVSGTSISAPVKLFSEYSLPSDHSSREDNPHGVTKSQVGLSNVPNVYTNDQTPTYSEASTLTELTNGEKLSVAFGKLKKAVSSLISHIANQNNPHEVTAEQAGAVPNSRKVNSKQLNADITLNASDVGAVPTTRKVNNKALTADVTLSASDVSALPVPTTASVGQYIVVKTVDGSGKVTAVEGVTMADAEGVAF